MKPANFAPVYCALYPQLAEVTRQHGYALAIHGSLSRDMDLICIPWTDEPSEPQAVLDALTSTFAIKEVGTPGMRAHGREVHTLAIGFGECFIDLSFMPRAAIRGGEQTASPRLSIEFHQWDWLPGFGGFLPGATTPVPDSRAFCVLNLGSILGAVATGDLDPKDMPYTVAETMMHEVLHALEQWAGTEFNEDRIEALLERYEAAVRGGRNE